MPATTRFFDTIRRIPTADHLTFQSEFAIFDPIIPRNSGLTKALSTPYGPIVPQTDTPKYKHMIPLFGSFALRPLQPDDAGDIFRAIDSQRAYLGKWLPFVALTRSEEDSRAFVDSALADPANPVCTLRAGGRFAGLIGFKSADPTTGTVEIGYWLCEEFQHQGIMTAAVRALRHVAFEELGMRRIEIRCATGNLPSNRIPQRLGMRLDRVEPQAETLSSGECIDLNVYVSEK